jgi:hypothetical protein
VNNQKPNSRMHYGLKTMASLCRGNTLIPIIIALSISLVASIAFLKQGADLGEKQKVIQAHYEVLEYLEEWVNLKKEKGGSTGVGGTLILPSELSFHGTKNIFGNYMRFEVRTYQTNAQRFEYPTQTQNQCELIRAQLEKYKIITNDETRCKSNATLLVYLRFI